MSKKSIFLIIMITASLLIGGLLGFYFYTTRNNPQPTFFGQPLTGRNFANYDQPQTATTTPSTTSTSTTEVIVSTSTEPEINIPRLRKISVEPIAGFSFATVDVFATTTANIEPEDLSRTGGVARPVPPPRAIGTEEKIRFINRFNGNIYQTSTSTLDIDRVSNTTIIRIQEAFFTGRGDSFMARDLIGSSDIIRTRYGSLVRSTTTEDSFDVVFTELPTNITQLALNPLKNRIFSIQKDDTTGIVTTVDGGSRQNILNTSFKEWLVQWPERRFVTLTTKPSGSIPGYMYLLNTENSSFDRIIGGINGLTTNTSPDTNKVLFGVSESGLYRLYVYNRTTRVTTPLNINSFPEKCIWSTKNTNLLYCAVPNNMIFNNYPDVWYQSRTVFSDNIWYIDINLSEYRMLSNMQRESGEIIDVDGIHLSPNEDYLLFKNKFDLSLWGFDLIDRDGE
jgi:hypothetical protein